MTTSHKKGVKPAQDDPMVRSAHLDLAAVEEEIRVERERRHLVSRLTHSLMRNLHITPWDNALKPFFPYADSHSNEETVRKWVEENLPDYEGSNIPETETSLSSELHRYLVEKTGMSI